MKHDTPHPAFVPHCGFSNAATWSVALFLDNDSPQTQKQARILATGRSRIGTGFLALQMFVRRSKWMPESWVRYVSRSATLQLVNWRELAEHLTAD